MTLTHVLDLFVKAWQDQEDSRRRKEEEDASLYRYKDQTHLDERTEEEKEEEDFREAFPSFQDVSKYLLLFIIAFHLLLAVFFCCV